MPLAILFDLDGTLVDTLELLLGSARHTFRDRPHRPTDAEWKAGIGTPLAEQLAPYAADPDELQRLVASYRAHQSEHLDRLTILYPGTADVMRTLHQRGHPLGIVTSKADAIAHRTLRHVGVDHLLDVVIGADATTRHKPDPEPVRVALERLGRAPADALFVGDSPHDVLSGNAAGVRTVAGLWGFFDRATLEAAGATYYLNDIGELPALVERVEG